MIMNYVFEALASDSTFILKKVILVRRSTVDFRSWSLSGLLAGKLFYSRKEKRKDGARHNAQY